MVEGYHRRLRRTREQAAEHAAWVLIPPSRGRVTPADLLGDKESEGDETITLNPKDYPNTQAFLAAVREAKEQRARHVD